MDLLTTVEKLYDEMFHSNIKNKINEIRPSLDAEQSINELFQSGKLDDIVKIYNINKYIRLFEPQDLLDIIKNNKQSERVLIAL